MFDSCACLSVMFDHFMIWHECGMSEYYWCKCKHAQMLRSRLVKRLCYPKLYCVSNVLLSVVMCCVVMCCVVFDSCACLSVVMCNFMMMIWYECGM